MNKVKVYRIECKGGGGFYRGESPASSYKIMQGFQDEYCHPSPSTDSMYEYNWKAREARDPAFSMSSHIFGFESLASLRRWFYDDAWVRGMVEYGMFLCTYEVELSELIVGRAQVTFPKGSVLVSKACPSTLLSE